MIDGIDTATSQRLLNFQAPWDDGHRVCYIKFGGDNNPRYESPYYAAQVATARPIGYRVGHYWVPEDSQDPAGSATFFVQNIDGWTKRDFAVLDNESFPTNDPDGSGPQTRSDRYSDAQAAQWVETVKRLLNIPGNQVLVYYGLADARATDHSKVLATGANFIIAAYSYGPFEFATPSNIPADRIVGHQTGGKFYPTTNGGTVAVDVNKFKDNAFAYDSAPNPNPGDDMADSAEQIQQLTNAMFYGGGSMEDGGQSVSRSLAQIQDKLDALSTGGIDVDVLADKIVERLPEQTGGGLTKADVIEALRSVSYKAQPDN